MEINKVCKKFRGCKVYCIRCFRINNEKRFREGYYTNECLYPTFEEALEYARQEASSWSWMDAAFKYDRGDANPTGVVCICSGMSISKDGKIKHGHQKIEYIIATNTKEYTDQYTPDPALKGKEPDEYLTPPVLTKDDFYDTNDS